MNSSETPSLAERHARKLAVILHGDVVGSTALVRRHETLAHERIQDTFRRFARTIAAYGGVAHELRGDAIVAEFNRASDAISAAIAFQTDDSARTATLEDDITPELRIGIGMGEVVVADNTVTGDGVVMAQRLEQLAEPRGVCIQGAAYETVPKRLPFEYVNQGEQKLKGFTEPVRTFAVSLQAGAAVPALESATQSEAPAPALPEKPSIAVLPFDNMSADPEQEYFSDAIAEDLITELSRFHSFYVIARNSSFSYKGRAVRVQELAEELRVQYVVEGSVRKAGNRVRITAQLVDARSGAYLWAERYDRELDDLFALQDEIAQTIVGAMTPELSQTEQDRAHRKPPRNLSAWEWYHRGLWHLYRFILEDLIEAERSFQRAIDLDPEFGPAHTGCAYAKLQQVFYSDPDDPEPLIESALLSAQRGCAHNEHDAMPHFVLGRILVRRGKWQNACAEANTAIELNPSLAYAHFGLGEALGHLTRFEESLAAFRMAARLSPRDPHAWTYVYFQAWPLIGLDRYAEAVDVSRAALLSPHAGFYALIPLISALGHLGNTAEAEPEIRTLLERQPGFVCSRMRRVLSLRGAFLEKVIDGLREAGLPE